MLQNKLLSFIIVLFFSVLQASEEKKGSDIALFLQQELKQINSEGLEEYGKNTITALYDFFSSTKKIADLELQAYDLRQRVSVFSQVIRSSFDIHEELESKLQQKKVWTDFAPGSFSFLISIFFGRVSCIEKKIMQSKCKLTRKEEADLHSLQSFWAQICSNPDFTESSVLKNIQDAEKSE